MSPLAVTLGAKYSLLGHCAPPFVTAGQKSILYENYLEIKALGRIILLPPGSTPSNLEGVKLEVPDATYG